MSEHNRVNVDWEARDREDEAEALRNGGGTNCPFVLLLLLVGVAVLVGLPLWAVLA